MLDHCCIRQSKYRWWTFKTFPELYGGRYFKLGPVTLIWSRWDDSAVGLNMGRYHRKGTLHFEMLVLNRKIWPKR